jgi:predicted dienelactone hydrolase
MRRLLTWILGAAGVLAVLLVVLFLGYQLQLRSNAIRPAHPVGVQQVSVPDPPGPPLAVAIWYPTDAPPKFIQAGLTAQWAAPNGPVEGHGLPLVVISHGNGGGPLSHADTAMALASAGFVVAAPMHTGDNYTDQSEVGGVQWLTDRPKHISTTIDYMLSAWSGHGAIDPARIGVFGFSAGGYTALTLIGGEPDLKQIAVHCAQQPEFVCRLWNPGSESLPIPANFYRDARIKAAVIAAPGFGFAFTPDSLAKVRAPVQLWDGSADTNTPLATNTNLVATELGPMTDVHIEPGAGHMAFLAPCGPIGPPQLCWDGSGFDRKAFHERFNAAVAQFFQERLKASP